MSARAVWWPRLRGALLNTEGYHLLHSSMTVETSCATKVRFIMLLVKKNVASLLLIKTHRTAASNRPTRAHEPAVKVFHHYCRSSGGLIDRCIGCSRVTSGKPLSAMQGRPEAGTRLKTRDRQQGRCGGGEEPSTVGSPAPRHGRAAAQPGRACGGAGRSDPRARCCPPGGAWWWSRSSGKRTLQTPPLQPEAAPIQPIRRCQVCMFRM